MKNNYFKNLQTLREKIKKYESTSSKDISSLLRIRKKFQKNYEKMQSELCKIDDLKDWKYKNGEILHKSGQFFRVKGVKVKNSLREVKDWEQIIFTQPHGGILALLARETKTAGIEFLLCLRSEPGDQNVKFCPSFSATKSNMNRAHGGKRTELYNLIIKKQGSRIIAKSAHNEEGARFWRKRNENWIVFLKDNKNKSLNKKHFVWANIWQIKKLCLEDCVINPFVKCILFMI